MNVPMHKSHGRLRSYPLALALAACVVSAAPAIAIADGEPCGKPGCRGHVGASGFQGFGLGYHLRYGYGGDALGVGPDGGYPFYGGPGYPHCEPQLRRCRPIVPFPYFGGPGGPGPGQPHYFGGVGPLVVDERVVTVESDGISGYADFGPFTGAVPYPESAFGPFAAAGAATTPGEPIVPATAEVTRVPAARRPQLGLDADPVLDAAGVRGLRIANVYPGTAAARAGLQPGDVIRSIDGRRTEQPDHVIAILNGSAPGKTLTLTVRRARDGKEHTVKAELP